MSIDDSKQMTEVIHYKNPQLKQSDVRQTCESKYKLLKNHLLGTGLYGRVYESCFELMCYAVKVIDLRQSNLSSDELAVGILMGEDGLGPKIYDMWICDMVGTNEDKLFSMGKVGQKGEDYSKVK